MICHGDFTGVGVGQTRKKETKKQETSAGTTKRRTKKSRVHAYKDTMYIVGKEKKTREKDTLFGHSILHIRSE